MLILMVQSLVSKKWCKHVHIFLEFTSLSSCFIFRLGQLREMALAMLCFQQGKNDTVAFLIVVLRELIDISVS